MRTGKLNKTITLKYLTTTLSGGDVTETWTGVTIRASVEQIEGTRYLKEDELVDRKVYRIITWDKEYGMNLQITYGSETLYPIRPPMVNSDGSNRGILTIIAATKA